MARKLYIAELEFQLHIQDASIWTTEFQEKLIESIQTAFEDINIPPNLETLNQFLLRKLIDILELV